MARPFDHGKARYRREHMTDSEQETRHILADNLLQHYGAKPENYATISDSNYRMGSTATNTRDRRLDAAIVHEVFEPGRSYDAARLAKPSGSCAGLSYQQQRDAIGRRFDMARQAYEETGEYKYYMMQKDLRDIASEHLDADLRQFRLSARHK